ncbi:MAG: GAF domain-containing protein [Defluviimonas sp.]|uniref:GAF domain-containing protein n=1 Tax=Albidovulum sp. TaxID=1872424 RepID=UPI001DFE3FBD|nr:GAF domain-containing protein [Paracoccaceae bacterium]MCC0062856.1 GAF domain-containing protein [Defluviimonas sp.]
MTPDTVFLELDRACGVRLFTITVQDPEAGLVRRAYSSNPVAYPVSGTKPLTLDDAWSRQVLVEKRSFVANTTAEFRDLFFDHAEINALGCHSAMNIPVLRPDGAVAGTVNLLDVEGHFTPGRVEEIERLVAAAGGGLLAAMQTVRL